VAFGSMRIGEYLLSRRIAAPGPQLQVGTVLELRKAISDTGPVSGAMVYFTDQPRPATRTGDWLAVLLPGTEFDLWYRVLRAEDPVYLAWHTSDDDVVTFIALSTSAEPPGEGVDSSPG
jgi:hypothetical protein